MNQYILDFKCKVLKGMKGWSNKRKINVNDMYMALQDLYSTVALPNNEIAAVFMTTKPEDGSHEFIYDVNTGKTVSHSRHGSGWYQDVADCVNYYLREDDLSYEFLKNTKKRFCVWHNHPGGSSVSDADLALLVDYFPLIHSAYIDTDTIVRVVLSDSTKKKLEDEEFRNDFMYKIRKFHKENSEECQDELEELMAKHKVKLTESAEIMERERSKGKIHMPTLEENQIRAIFKNDFDLVHAKYEEIEVSKMARFFDVFHFSKKEVINNA